MSKLLFSIITTTYNRVESGYLEDNILAVQAQRNSGDFGYEHIIVDDGSTDDTKALVEKYAKTDQHIKYIHQPNAGPAKATQNGIAHATGEYVVIVDDDDLLAEDSLFIRSSVIEKNKNIDFFYGLADWIDQYGLPITPLFQSREITEYLYERMLISNCINAGTPTVRRSELMKIKWPEWLSRSQDYFLWLELLRPEKKLQTSFINDVVVKYRYHAQNYTSAINDDVKKQDKAALNLKIKQLHQANLVYLAEEAFKWVNEAHAANEYRLLQLKHKDARINELQQAFEYYAHSRVVRYSVKLRNVTRGQVIDRIVRLNHKSKKVARKLLAQKKPMTYRLVGNERWHDQQPLVSIVTPFYNRSDTMPDTIQSVLGQTFQNFEYIIVDDGSTNLEAKDYLNKINHPKIQIIHQKNQGVAAARNTGIKQAKGKYIICLDSDDIIDPTYIEKSVIALETNHNISIVTYDMQMFGVKDDVFHHPDYNPYGLIEDNPILTSAMFRKEVWEATGGYKSNIGYEDWEYWVNAAEHGYFGMHIEETLFKYRTAEVSRYVDDLSNHKQHAAYIRDMHPHFNTLVRRHKAAQTDVAVIDPSSALVNINNTHDYLTSSKKQQVLVVVPWMTFGGAETLIYNYCKEVMNEVDLTFVTGLDSPHEWEYKFRELSSRIYHLANLFDDEKLYLEFTSNLVATRNISVLHIVHSGYAFSMLEELKKRHPKLKVIVTLFNDRAAYFEQAVEANTFIDVFTADNHAVADHYEKRITAPSDVRVIPNGVDAQRIYNPTLYDRNEARRELRLKEDEYAVFFIGRLSEEKNPDVFVEVAKRIISAHDNVQFYMIGDGNMREDVESLINAAATDRITYLGYKSVVATYLSAADIFVLPSSIEGFPLSILEAMAMEVVPIASDVGAVSEVIDSGVNGYVVTPGSVSEITQTIKDIVKNDEKFNNIRRASRQKVLDNYSTELLGENYKKLYRGEK